MGDLATELAEHDFWYHTIELPGGTRTPGLFDMPRALSQVRMPESLSGKRCLDVGTAEGFWAFEMERRGASEVVAMDLGEWALFDWPPAYGPVHQGEMDVVPRFRLAHEALDSRVEWVAGSVYDLTPEVHGEFDFVFLGSLLIHLRDPVRALSAVRTVLRGELLLNDAISLPLTLLRPRQPVARLAEAEQPAWWVPNVAGLRRLAETAGYRVLAAGGPYFLRFGKGRATAPQQILAPVPLTPLQRLPLQLIRNARDRLGIPHAWLVASPRPDLANEPPPSDLSPAAAVPADVPPTAGITRPSASPRPT
ncbi:MAG: class I SAM-dependent methyltransferase [Actinomycetota bacterium]|nr:class I SAM-dependent methyltransferase [Actinomycetota bacterium]MDQ3720791.1 class I SAM-dependent methyltransferase [Actinomycetota bacterium]